LKLTVEWGVLAIGLSAATSLISSFIPAFLAAILSPIEAMRRG
jgi:ABC-type antimicrobial peptide transport system permease subunit